MKYVEAGIRMSYWGHHPELYEEIIIKEMIRRGLATEDEEPEVVMKRFEERPDMLDIDYNATADYWGSMIDDAWERHREEQLQKGLQKGSIKRD